MNSFDWPLSNSLQDPEKPRGDAISSYFAITAGSAWMVGLESHPGLHLVGFAVGVPATFLSENGRNLGTQVPQNAVTAAALAGTHQAADSAPESYNMCSLEQQTWFANQAHEPTWPSYHSGKSTQGIYIISDDYI